MSISAYLCGYTYMCVCACVCVCLWNRAGYIYEAALILMACPLAIWRPISNQTRIITHFIFMILYDDYSYSSLVTLWSRSIGSLLIVCQACPSLPIDSKLESLWIPCQFKLLNWWATQCRWAYCWGGVTRTHTHSHTDTCAHCFIFIS